MAGAAVWPAVLALSGLDRQRHRRPGVPGRWAAALTRSRHPLQAHPALGTPAAALVALPQVVAASLPALPWTVPWHPWTTGLSRRVGAGASRSADPLGRPVSRRPTPRGPAGLEPASRPAAPGPGKPGSQCLVAPDPGRGPGGQTTPGLALAQPAAAPTGRTGAATGEARSTPMRLQPLPSGGDCQEMTGWGPLQPTL